ncbi:hypothetical protein M407DRAFT_30931 [Tulasnella calospora MUT 4182]|uniref:Uncharacterized protein n=1 Tax=Tulasnella calospora MUT 4182 TaxID=1051891 RepID=A0A0C3KDD1_9AGAM|nr:hypothetical protein M407DRAFT_30931 [Tulasnella calospora MUT 4182]
MHPTLSPAHHQQGPDSKAAIARYLKAYFRRSSAVDMGDAVYQSLIAITPITSEEIPRGTEGGTSISKFADPSIDDKHAGPSKARHAFLLRLVLDCEHGLRM